MQIDNLLKLIDDLLPPETAMAGDKLGLQIQGDENDLRKFLITMEITTEVIEEAKALGTDCIITFHPLIFHPLQNITNQDRVGLLAKKIISSNLTIISIHTNFDSYENGTSKVLSDKLGFISKGFLVHDKIFADTGMGLIAEPQKPLSPNELIETVSSVCGSPVRFNEIGSDRLISRIAIVGGSGSSFIDDALNNDVDAFITSDISYHQFHRVNGRLMLIDPGHYEMEQFVAPALAMLLKSKIAVELVDWIKVSKTITNPVRYFPNTQKYIDIQIQNIINN